MSRPTKKIGAPYLARCWPDVGGRLPIPKAVVFPVLGAGAYQFKPGVPGKPVVGLLGCKPSVGLSAAVDLVLARVILILKL